MQSENKRFMALAAVVLSLALAACEKSTKTSSAGGGTSTQSVMTFRGGAQ